MRATGRMRIGLTPVSSPPPAPPAPATPVAARVEAVEDGRLDLALAGRRVTARRAASCLVEPAPHDTVLAVETSAGAFVVAVLERSPDAEVVLSVPDAPLAAFAQEGLAVRCESLTVDAGRTTLRGRVARVASGVLSAVAEQLDVVARTLRRSADHEVTRAGAAVRTVDGAQTVTAGEMMVEARSAMSQRAGIVLIDAREDVRVNGERITMG